MSDLATTYHTSVTRFSSIALVLAIASVATWFASFAVDELWLGAAFLGLVAVALGWRARRDAKQASTRAPLALAAMLVGGLVAAQVLLFTTAWLAYHLLT